jgi:hypothetical protein
MMQRLFVLHCPGCQETIVLPRRSLLGTCGHLQYRPTDIWPLTYLCQYCGLVSELQAEAIRLESVEAPDQSQHSESLWSFEFSCGRANYERHLTIYTKGLKGGAQRDVIGNVLGRTVLCPEIETATLLRAFEYS